MARQLAIAIGVEKSGNLVRLPGAVAGARAFAEWAEGACFDVVLLTDEDDAKVKADDIFDAVDEAIAFEDLERLFIYFAGHGVSLGVDVDYWLLSPGPRDPNRGAVNLAHSLKLARGCGIPHIAVFADHCRTMADKPRQGVLGSSIFPACNIVGTPEIDEFYAALPGDDAQEVSADAKHEKAFGIFTRALMAALEGKDRKAADPQAVEPPFQAVTARSLRDRIGAAVGDLTDEIAGAASQTPASWPKSYYPPNALAWIPVSDQATLTVEARPNIRAPRHVRILKADGQAGARFELAGEGALPLAVDLPAGTYYRVEAESTLITRQDDESLGVHRLTTDASFLVGLVPDRKREEPVEPSPTARTVVIDETGAEHPTAPGEGIYAVETSDPLTHSSAVEYQVLDAGARPEPVRSSGTGAVVEGEVADVAVEVEVDRLSRARQVDRLSRARDRVEAEVKLLAGARGRDSFETQVGLTVLGARPRRAVAVPGHVGLFEEGGAWHVRGQQNKAGSVVIELNGGKYALAAFFPGLIGAIAVGERGVDQIAYMPALGSLYDRGGVDPESVRKALARATRAVRKGRFEVSIDQALDVAGHLRQYKHVNPTLGVFAAYAYDRAGRLDQIEDMIRYFEMEGQAIPYDLVMLAGRDPATVAVPVAPRFPMLTQGWAYLDPRDLHPAMAAARESLAPALWATPQGAGGQALAEALEKGELP